MEEKKLELIKKSILIHNDEGKILVLKSVERPKIYVPSISIFDASKNCEQVNRYKKLIDLLFPLDELEFLSQTKKEVHDSERKSDYKNLLHVREQILYYAYYHVLQKEEIEQIMKLSYLYSFEPYMFTPLEILNSNCTLEKGCKPAVRVLQNKLKYKVY